MLKTKNLKWRDIKMTEIRLERLVTHFAQCNQAEGKSPKTVHWYSQMLTDFIKFLNKQGVRDTLAEFNSENVRAFIVAEQNRGLSPFSVQGKVRSLKAFSSWLTREAYTPENVLIHVPLPKVPTKVIQPLTDNEIGQLLSVRNPLTAIGSRDIAILITLLGTGIRESEIADLRYEDAHINEGYLKVMGKGAKERVVPTGSLGQKILWRYVFHFRPEPINDLNNCLFLSLDGRKLAPNAIRLLMARWGKRAGVTRLHCHLCRHTYATNFLLLNCGDVFRLQQILGHTTLDMVRHYVHYASAEAMIQGQVRSPVDRLEVKQLRGYKLDRTLAIRRS